VERIALTSNGPAGESEIFVGAGLTEFMVRDLCERPLGNRLGVVTDTRVGPLVAEGLLERLVRSGLRADLLSIPPGEASKRWETARSIFEWMADEGFDRRSALLAVGGGVVGDLTGFAASLYMRSIPCAQVPTTLLAQVDSSMGGKTAIDFGERKNLLGTFHQPRRVYTDPEALATLPPEEMANGMAEVIKSAIVRDPEFFGFLERRRDAVLAREGEVMETVVARCCRIKSSVVMEDEKDTGTRQILNFGHTVGHAVEVLSDYAVSHGAAVSMGIAAETALACRMGLLPAAERDRILRLLRAYGLPSGLPRSYDRGRLADLMKGDKKAENGRILMALPTAVGAVSIRKEVARSEIQAALEEVAL
jgi:3-dehydroquinate synthase